MREIVGRSPKQTSVLWVPVGLGLFWTGYWTVQLARGDDRAPIIVAVVVAFVGLSVAVLLNGRTSLVLTDDELILERRHRPLRVERAAVRAVHGDVPDRPTWSEVVVVEHDSGSVRLPPIDVPPGTVIERLQRWADVGERPGTSAPPATVPRTSSPPTAHGVGDLPLGPDA
ncbi:hypothetical protein Bcav_1405 [Beutenbergia cavernae DSM 12333]|uniref:PH domain-containing protein n=1 Tax=Beutenbergia cavernae (strain ATCC BAA-8 / DSM 12333 / CCUG 43141 / JCM 11478 / NBRC 16432 / NCIMB 13614 / HKI 0122) TaxID=471853 RepID=C5C2H7_BEUC1|nr:hypothetical protein [Beutenbergia cavernae]ACQ79663.1 hypothetical protein Bcav_1405 [Beutenbergia cavernae DSM 12333]